MNKEKNYAINFTLFKTMGVYQMVDPSTKKLFGFNIFHFVIFTITIFSTITTILGLYGFFFEAHTYETTDSEIVFLLLYLLCIIIGTYKTVKIITNANKIWSLFNVLHDSFLSNKHSKRNFYKIIKCGEQTSTFFSVYFYLMAITVTLYTMVPIILNIYFHSDQTLQTETIRKVNILNLRYPISTETYNAFYKVVYVMEFIIVIFIGFGEIAFDILTMTINMIISAQYENIALACEALKPQVDNKNGNLIKVTIQI